MRVNANLKPLCSVHNYGERACRNVAVDVHPQNAAYRLCRKHVEEELDRIQLQNAEMFWYLKYRPPSPSGTEEK